MRRLALVCAAFAGLGINAIAQNQSTATTNPIPVGAVCDGNNFELEIDGMRGGSTSCCQSGNEEFFVGPRGNFAHRSIGPACTMLDGSTNCDDGSGSLPKCLYGPCGGHVLPDTLKDSVQTVIFIPRKSSLQACGHQTWLGEDRLYDPEEYILGDNHQTNYSGVNPSCVYTACIAGIGPAYDGTITTVDGGAIGRVVSDPPGIKISGTGAAIGRFARNVTLIAEPTGEHARAVFFWRLCQDRGLRQEGRVQHEAGSPPESYGDLRVPEGR
jgi:hypothetical protein